MLSSRFLMLSVLLLVTATANAASPSAFPIFQNDVLPPGGAGKWQWVQGDGELRLDARGHLVLLAEKPAAGGDNRTGAVIDLGHAGCESFVLDLSIDPASQIKGQGCNGLDCGVTVGLKDLKTPPNRFGAQQQGLALNIRDLSDQADYGLFFQGRDLTLPVAPGSGTGNPRAFRRHDGFYDFRLIVTPQGEGSLLRVYHTQFVTPAWEGRVATRITAGNIGLYARLAGRGPDDVETTIRALSLRPLPPEIASRKLTDAEQVLYALNLDHPGLEAVQAAMKKQDIPQATAALATYLRTRKNVNGPQLPTAPLTAKEQRIADLMTRDTIEVYTGGPLFQHTFGKPYDWAVDPYDTGGQFAIYNSRMYPWLYMGRAYRASGEEKYAQTFVRQLNSWLDQIPLRIVAKPGGKPFFIDGASLEPPLRFTGNMGRRIELTWWQAFECFKTAIEFDDASLLRMMQYFQQNARLAANPSIFYAWDDSGLHLATGLLQCALMMPEWREAGQWKSTAVKMLQQTLDAQVHKDGTHASLSTGYGWATVDSYRNVFDIFRRNGQAPPEEIRQSIRGIVMGYMGILRPDFGNISLNDGGWSHVDDKVRDALKLFPGDQELEYFATRGAKGQAPTWTSRYFPNAGWYAMRTGFGPREKMLLMDGGPFGASHGKQDALHLVLALGNHLLLRDGGRGDYTQKPASQWASKTLAFNTITPDYALQDRTHRYEHEKHVGMHPPQRPWISNKHFDYGRSQYNAGWFKPGQHIHGLHTRHVVFLKGQDPPTTGYWLVIDQIEPADDKPHTWRQPWHLGANSFQIDPQEQSVTTEGAGAGLKILPVCQSTELTVQSIKGQTQPAMQGWQVHGSESRPHAVPVHSWTTRQPTTIAWLLLPRQPGQKQFEVQRVAKVQHNQQRLRFTVVRADGGRDEVQITNDEARSVKISRFGKTGKIEAELQSPALP